MARVRDNGRGIAVAALIVIANFLIVLQVTGISYGRFQWADFLTAYNTPTATPTKTPTVTPTPLPNGAGCSTGPRCASGFCVDGVCCDTACEQPGQFCNLLGMKGTCAFPAAPAPALNGGGLAAGAAVLVAIGALTLLRRRRSPS